MSWRKNDIGGEPGGPIDTDVAPSRYWERESDALRRVMGGQVSLDELRRAMEDLPQELYDSGFYQRRVLAMAAILVEKGVLSEAEIAARRDQIAARDAAPPEAALEEGAS